MDASMMSSMGGSRMDNSSGGIFLSHNKALARIYWYLVAACILLAGLQKALGAINARSRSAFLFLFSQVAVEYVSKGSRRRMLIAAFLCIERESLI